MKCVQTSDWTLVLFKINLSTIYCGATSILVGSDKAPLSGLMRAPMIAIAPVSIVINHFAQSLNSFNPSSEFDVSFMSFTF